MSTTGSDAENTIRMTPQEEAAAIASSEATVPTEPADEGIGVHSDQDGDDHTEN